MIEIARSAVGQLERIARGGQGTIYRAPQLHLPNQPGPLVFKEYRSQLVRLHGQAIRHALGTMVAVRAKSPDAVRNRIDARSMWPLAVVVDGTSGVGLIMRELDAEFFTPFRFSTGRTARLVREVQLYMQPAARIRARGLTSLDSAHKLYLLFKISAQLSFLHNTLNVVVGDVSGKNIAFSPGAGGARHMKVVFIDTDSFRAGDSVPPMAQPNTPDWEAPEVLEFTLRANDLKRTGGSVNEIQKLRSRARVQRKESDTYKFGLLTVRLFHDGEDQTMVRSSPSAEQALRKLLGTSRTNVLVSTLEPNPRNRPNMNSVAAAIRG